MNASPSEDADRFAGAGAPARDHDQVGGRLVHDWRHHCQLAAAGTAFRLEVGHQSVPLFIYKSVENFAAAMEQYVTETLRQGLYGWQVIDCPVSLIRSQYSVPDGPPSTSGPLSSPQDFRKLTPLVLMAALKRAGTVVCEPIHHFRLETPADTLNVLLPVLARLHAVPGVTATNDSWCTLAGDIPVAKVHELRQQIPPLTRGEGILESSFDRYEPARTLAHSPAPTRPRTDDNPLNRAEYLNRVTRRGAPRLAEGARRRPAPARHGRGRARRARVVPGRRRRRP
jgi:ribosomal protection tetracycline resistance protein